MSMFSIGSTMQAYLGGVQTASVVVFAVSLRSGVGVVVLDPGASLVVLVDVAAAFVVPAPRVDVPACLVVDL